MRSSVLLNGLNRLIITIAYFFDIEKVKYFQMLPKRFTSIKYRFDEFKRLNLIFQNDQENYSLYFDGLNVTYKPFLINTRIAYADLKNSIEKEESFFQINSIRRRDDDIIFILFSDGTIFQIYFMMDDERGCQMLSEFGRNHENANSMTPLGISEYNAAIKRYELGDECKIDVDEAG